MLDRLQSPWSQTRSQFDCTAECFSPFSPSLQQTTHIQRAIEDIQSGAPHFERKFWNPPDVQEIFSQAERLFNACWDHLSWSIHWLFWRRAVKEFSCVSGLNPSLAFLRTIFVWLGSDPIAQNLRIPLYPVFWRKTIFNLSDSFEQFVFEIQFYGWAHADMLKTHSGHHIECRQHGSSSLIATYLIYRPEGYSCEEHRYSVHIYL